MKLYFEALNTYIEQHPPNFGDGECIRRRGTTAGPQKSDTLTAENRHPFRWSDS